MLLTFHTTDGQPLIVASDDLLGVVADGASTHIKIMSYDSYIKVTETWDQLEPILNEIADY